MPFVIPLRDRVILRISRFGLLQGTRISNGDGVLRHFQSGGHGDGATGITDALEATVARGIGLPAFHADDIELAVGGAEAGAHDAGGELEGKLDDAALHGVAAILLQDSEEGRHAVGSVEEVMAEWTPS